MALQSSDRHSIAAVFIIAVARPRRRAQHKRIEVGSVCGGWIRSLGALAAVVFFQFGKLLVGSCIKLVGLVRLRCSVEELED